MNKRLVLKKTVACLRKKKQTGSSVSKNDDKKALTYDNMNEDCITLFKNLHNKHEVFD